MSYVSGIPIDETTNLPQQTRDRIAERMIELTLEELFDFGVMQTDPNFANYLFDPETEDIALLDFGAAREIDPKIAAQYRDLLAAGLAGDRSEIARVSQDIGFFTTDTDDIHQDQIIGMIEFVFKNLGETRPFDFATNVLSMRMQAMGMALAESGFIPPPLPIDILLVQRKLGGMFLLAKRLGARVDAAALLKQRVACVDARRVG